MLGSRSPQRPLRPRDRFFRSYRQIESGERYQRVQKLFSDFEDVLLQINGDFLAKEEKIRAEVPRGVHIEDLSNEFTYVSSVLREDRVIMLLRQFLDAHVELGAS